MSAFRLAVAPTWLSVVSTNAPFGIGVVSWRITSVMPLSAAALHAGALSPVTVLNPPAETFRTAQSVPAVLAAVGWQTGLLKVATISMPDTVKLLNFGVVGCW